MAEILTQRAIREGLRSKAGWQNRALELLFSWQTEAEREMEHTGELNGRGFSRTDSEILTSFAKQMAEGRPLSPRQREVAAKELPKYSRQIWRHYLAGLSTIDRWAAEDADRTERLAANRVARAYLRVAA